MRDPSPARRAIAGVIVATLLSVLMLLAYIVPLALLAGTPVALVLSVVPKVTAYPVLWGASAGITLAAVVSVWLLGTDLLRFTIITAAPLLCATAGGVAGGLRYGRLRNARGEGSPAV